MLVVLILVEISDVIFAVDSIPAIFAITTDPFIVLSANLFAILGLRAMFFLLSWRSSHNALLTIWARRNHDLYWYKNAAT